MEMTKEELLQEFDSFISEIGQYQNFISYLEKKGYKESEYEEVMESARE